MIGERIYVLKQGLFAGFFEVIMMLSIEFFNQTYKGKEIKETALKELFVHNGDDEFICYCGAFEAERRTAFNITDKLYEKWSYDGIDLNIYLYLEDNHVTYVDIHKFRENYEYGGRIDTGELTPTQQELRVARRILEYVIL